jgi:hypothetical protein
MLTNRTSKKPSGDQTTKDFSELSEVSTQVMFSGVEHALVVRGGMRLDTGSAALIVNRNKRASAR